MEYSGYIKTEHFPNTNQKISVNYNIFQTIMYPISGDDQFEIVKWSATCSILTNKS